MNEEEKKVIEELEEFIKGPCETCKYCEAAYKLNRKNIIQLLNLTKKFKKENVIYVFNTFLHSLLFYSFTINAFGKYLSPIGVDVLFTTLPL